MTFRSSNARTFGVRISPSGSWAVVPLETNWPPAVERYQTDRVFQIADDVWKLVADRGPGA